MLNLEPLPFCSRFELLNAEVKGNWSCLFTTIYNLNEALKLLVTCIIGIIDINCTKI